MVPLEKIRPRRRTWMVTAGIGLVLTIAGGAGVLLGWLQSEEGGAFSTGSSGSPPRQRRW